MYGYVLNGLFLSRFWIRVAVFFTQYLMKGIGHDGNWRVKYELLILYALILTKLEKNIE